MRSTGIGRSWKSRWPITSIATTSRAAISSAPRCASSSSAGASTQRGRVYAGGCRIGPLNEVLAGVFDEYDAILTPAAPGEAPRGPREHRQPGFLLDLDVSRHARDARCCDPRRGCRSAFQLVGRRRKRCAPLAQRAGLSTLSRPGGGGPPNADDDRQDRCRPHEERQGVMTMMMITVTGIGICCWRPSSASWCGGSRRCR